MANLVNYCPHFLKVQQIGRSLNPILTEGVWKLFADIRYVTIKNLEEKDGQTQLLCYVSLIRACNKVL